MATRKTPQDAPPIPEEQPAGSGAVPGSEQGAETFGEELKGSAAGMQVAPGVNDGTQATPEDAEIAQTEADDELADAAEEPMVYYTGEFGRREITAQEWANAGIPDMPTVLWERRTGHKVPASMFGERALQMLRQDGNFRVSE